MTNLVSLIAMQFSDNLPGLEAIHYIFAFLFPFYGFFGTLLMVFRVAMKNSLAGYFGDPQMGYLDWDSKIPIILIAVSPTFNGDFRALHNMSVRQQELMHCLSFWSLDTSIRNLAALLESLRSLQVRPAYHT